MVTLWDGLFWMERFSVLPQSTARFYNPQNAWVQLGRCLKANAAADENGPEGLLSLKVVYGQPMSHLGEGSQVKEHQGQKAEAAFDDPLGPHPYPGRQKLSQLRPCEELRFKYKYGRQTGGRHTKRTEQERDYSQRKA